jgi:rfaE bifunctional protein nucleotidyltransferase chain/domain
MLIPDLASAVNEDAIAHVLTAARLAGVKRFIYASSVAAYGSSSHDAKETDPLKPTTLYAEAKEHCEHYVRAANEKGFETVIARPASVCGFSLCQRFDLTVNMMVHDAMRKGTIKVNGGDQKRSHIHMHDMLRAYKALLEAPAEKVAGETFNFVAQNLSVMETAIIVSDITEADIEVGPATDNRSYTVDGTKAREGARLHSREGRSAGGARSEGQVRQRRSRLHPLLRRRGEDVATSPAIVLANGTFDPLHYGHVLHLREAKKLGDILIVSVTRNASVKREKGAERPAFDEEERADMLRELRCVDRVILVDGLLEALYLVWPNVLVKGAEYDGRIQPAHEEFCKSNGVEIVLTKTKKYSSTEMLGKGYFDRSQSR